jgi:hypothetical protein
MVLYRCKKKKMKNPIFWDFLFFLLPLRLYSLSYFQKLIANDNFNKFSKLFLTSYFNIVKQKIQLAWPYFNLIIYINI